MVQVEMISEIMEMEPHWYNDLAPEYYKNILRA